MTNWLWLFSHWNPALSQPRLKALCPKIPKYTETDSTSRRCGAFNTVPAHNQSFFIWEFVRKPDSVFQQCQSTENVDLWSSITFLENLIWNSMPWESIYTIQRCKGHVKVRQSINFLGKGSFAAFFGRFYSSPTQEKLFKSFTIFYEQSPNKKWTPFTHKKSYSRLQSIIVVTLFLAAARE